MHSSRGLSPRALTLLGCAFSAILACESATTTVPRSPVRGASFILAPDSDSISSGQCTTYDLGHCEYFPVTTNDLDWLQEAADGTTCSWMRSWMNASILHGWVHKNDESSYMGQSVYAYSHWPAGSIGSTQARVHLDYQNAFVSYQALSFTFRHEVAHIYGYGRNGAESQADSVASACGI
jgi:hypothetical protein